MSDPREVHGASERDPAAGLTEEERARATRRLVDRLLAGGSVFLAVVVLGMIPALLPQESPALGRASAAAWIAAAAIGTGLLVFAAIRLRR